jgi:uncharacterized protein with gpF-like domain
MVKLIDAMCDQVTHVLVPMYNRVAQHGYILSMTFPFGELNTELDELEVTWQKAFDHAAFGLAYEANYRALRHHDLAMSGALQRKKIIVAQRLANTDGTEVTMDSAESSRPKWADFAIKFDMTDRLKQTIKNQLKDNVDLIKRIPKKFHDDIRHMTRRSVEAGRDVVGFTNDLEEEFDITRRHAALIARDQNNKMTSMFHRTRQLDCGITRAYWVETFASMHPREEHTEWSETGESYDVEQGMTNEDGDQVWPGTEINCGCLADSIIPGYNEEAE